MTSGYQAEIGVQQQEAGFGYSGSRHWTDSAIDNLTATPSGTQANSLVLNSMVSRVTTVATAGDGVKLPVSRSGLQVRVINASANILNVWPNETTTIIDQLGAGNAYAIPPGGIVLFDGATAGQWHTNSDQSYGPLKAYNAVSTVAASITLTGAQIAGGTDEVTVDMTGTQAGAVTLTLPTVAQLVTAMTAAGINPQPGMVYELDIIGRDGTHAYTVTTSTGWTLTGTMTVTNQLRKFYLTLTSLSAAKLVSIGTYTVGAS